MDTVDINEWNEGQETIQVERASLARVRDLLNEGFSTEVLAGLSTHDLLALAQAERQAA